eukprot:1191310-Prorocentrum_minimum.AAC.2
MAADDAQRRPRTAAAFLGAHLVRARDGPVDALHRCELHRVALHAQGVRRGQEGVRRGSGGGQEGV